MSGSQQKVRGMTSQSPGKQQKIHQNSIKGYTSQSTTSIGSASGLNTNYFLAKNKKTSSTPSRVSNAFLELSPLKGVRPEGMINNQTAEGFKDYLKGELNEEELIYIRNFPSLYAHLPEPKKLYLRMYIRETKGLPELSQKDSLEDRDSVKTNGEAEGNDTEDDYMEDEEFFRKLKSQQGTRHENGHAIGSGNRKPQKSVAFRDQPEGRKSIIMDKINSIQNMRMSSLKNYQDSIAEKQQRRVRLQNITKSISTLKSIISDNVSLRKNSNGCPNNSMENTKLFSNISGIESSFKQRIENKDLMSSSDGNKSQGAGVLEVRKHLRNLSIITQKVDEQAEKADNGLKDECQTQKLLYKRYFSENADTFMNSLQQPYDPRLRTLLQNSDSQYHKFLHSYLSKAQFQRQKLSQSLHSTALKELTYKDQFVFEGKDLLELNQEQTELGRGLLDQIGDLDNFQEKYMVLSLDKLSSGIRVPPPKPLFVPKTRPMQVRQIENQLRKQSSHNTFYQKANRSASTASTLKGNRSASQTMLSLDNNQLLQQSQQQSQQDQSHILLNNQNAKGNSNSISSNLYQPQSQLLNNNNRQTNVSSKQSQRSLYKLSQISSLSQVAMVTPLQTPNNKWISSFFPGSPQQQQQNQQNNQSTPSNQQPSSQSPQFKQQLEISNEGKQQQSQQQQQQQQQSQQKSQPQQQQDNHYLSNSYKAKVQRKVALQQLKGYHIIKRNLSEHITSNNKSKKSNNNDDIRHDESDDSSNASRTEATLDQLYGESIAIQTKILKETPDGLVRKLKQLIKLENLKKEVMDANLYKLEKK